MVQSKQQPQRPTCSVVVPVYNRPKASIEALQSVAAQTMKPNRIVVVDDGSTDDTALHIRKWMEQHDQAQLVHLIQQPNGGVSAARNRGVEESEGCEIIVFLDSDDLWPPTHLQSLVDAMAGQDQVVAACTSRIVHYPTKNRERLWDHSKIADNSAYQLMIDNMPTPSCMAVRRQAFLDSGGFDLQYRCFEDLDLNLRLCHRGQWLYVDDEPIRMRRSIEETRGEQQNLSDMIRQVDHQLLRAAVIERFIESGGKTLLEGKPWGEYYAFRWYRIGKKLLREGRKPEAVWCFAKAAKANPSFIKARVFAALYRLGNAPKCPLEQPMKNA